ncbi:MAG: hypothetical protein HFE90_11455 [Firmicutes bacterium]|nr:hypothetical protein [Bacillota bacterium]
MKHAAASPVLKVLRLVSKSQHSSWFALNLNIRNYTIYCGQIQSKKDGFLYISHSKRDILEISKGGMLWHLIESGG